MKLIVDTLSLRRGRRLLFSGLSFSAAPGAYVEVRGANGAGKTSLLRALAGWLRPESGEVRYEGAAAPALEMHVLGHRDGVKPQMSAREHVRCWRGLLGAPPMSDLDVLAHVGLARAADLEARALSQGQQRRLALARLIACPRTLWLLDEPAAALDAEGRARLAEMIAAHCAAGGLAIAAAHEPIGPNPNHVVRL